jgi:REP element-mobilizing transposase RayT
MSQSLSFIALHLVFSTKERRKTIPADLLPELHAVIATLINENGGRTVIVGGTPDHVHAVFLLDRTTRPTDLIREIKHRSSRWLTKQTGASGKFQWQNGYGLFSSGRSQIEALTKYVNNQAHHHQTVTFQQELLSILNKYGVEHNSRFLWD